ncbi:MAG: methionyl-tRNA formyltransferase [Candidatus Omnitrophota bacterium]
MNIIFFGSGAFGVKTLEILRETRHNIALVVTQPDRQKGRHMRLSATPVKEFAQRHGLEVFQPQNVNTATCCLELQKMNADIFLVVAYGMILSEELLQMPRALAMNIHASLLPKYRGAAPIHWAIRNGEKESGITFIKMNKRMDAGDVILQKKIKITPKDTTPALEEKLSLLAAQSLPEVLAKLEKGKLGLIKQDGRKTTLAPLLKKSDGLIDWHWSSAEVFNHLRAMVNWPGSFTKFKGKTLKILSMEMGRKMTLGRPGEILSVAPTGLQVACGQGTVVIKEVLPESHHRMSIESFLAGHNIHPGDLLGV